MGCGWSWLTKKEEAFVPKSIPQDIPSVLLLGLDGAGKSCLFYRMKIKVCFTTQPTTGYNVDVFTPVKGLRFAMWDIGGGAKLRKLWSNYYAACRAVIFMVDSANHSKFQEARSALHDCMSNPAMPDYAPVIILANKQDEQNAATPEQISMFLDIHQLGRNHPCTVIGTSVIKNAGVLESMVQLKHMLKSTSQLKYWT
ncbi:uncharacterized protein LOC134815879 [Bolinopsis microptera]|uniref:uncharacterized protein LOC134815879 n=1 Tax=Bolinopsis microptera TaxID=2820187 RepID=UPI00307A092F